MYTAPFAGLQATGLVRRTGIYEALALYPWSHSVSWNLANAYRNGE